MSGLTATRLSAAPAAGAFPVMPVRAQKTVAVGGRVMLEDNGGPVHGAVIVVVGAGAVGLTDDDGGLEIDGVPAGSYEVLAQREHLTADRRTVTVAVGETTEVDFVLGLSVVPEELPVTASVAGAEPTLEALNAVTTLDSLDIPAEGANTIGEALQKEPGIASRSFGPGTSRPIIRGFDGDRVLILEDGVRTIGEARQNEPGIASRSFGPGPSRPTIRGFDGDRVLILEDGVRTGDLCIPPFSN